MPSVNEWNKLEPYAYVHDYQYQKSALKLKISFKRKNLSKALCYDWNKTTHSTTLLFYEIYCIKQKIISVLDNNIEA